MAGHWLGGGGRIVNAMFYSSMLYVHASVTPLKVLQLRLKIKNIYLFLSPFSTKLDVFGGLISFSESTNLPSLVVSH